jgi:predicted metalloprotease with PDZ domain
MRRLAALVAVLPVAFALAGGSALAGGPDCQKGAAAASTAHAHKKCTMSKEDCMHAMAEAKARGWLGLELDKNEADGTLTITKVVTGSPAAAAGFREGDVLLALNGVTFDEKNHDKLGAIKKAAKPGDRVTYNVRRNGSDQNISAILGTMPEEVYTAWTKEHMKEHAAVAAR